MRNYTKSVSTYFRKKEEAQKRDLEKAKLESNIAIETVKQNRKKYNILNNAAEQRMLASYSIYADQDSVMSSSPHLKQTKIKKSPS